MKMLRIYANDKQLDPIDTDTDPDPDPDGMMGYSVAEQ
jgi:hypothetical protein